MKWKLPLLFSGILLGFLSTQYLAPSLPSVIDDSITDVTKTGEFASDSEANSAVKHNTYEQENKRGKQPNKISPSDLIARRYLKYYSIFQDPMKSEDLKIRKVIENRNNYLGFLEAFDFSVDEKNNIIELITEKEIGLLKVFAENVKRHGELKSLEALSDYNTLTESIDDQLKSDIGIDLFELLERYRLAIPQLKNFNDLNSIYISNNEPLSLSQRILLMETVNTWAGGSSDASRIDSATEILSESQYNLFEDYLLYQDLIKEGNSILDG